MPESGVFLDLDAELDGDGFGFTLPGSSEGTLLYWSPVLQDTPLASVPANGAALVNLASAQCASLLSVSESTTHPVVSSSAVGGSFLAAEISGLGGVHVASTQAGGQNAAAWWAVDLPQSIYDHFLADIPTNGGALAVCAFYQVTRQMVLTGNTAPQAAIRFTAGAAATGNYIAHASAGNTTAQPNNIGAPSILVPATDSPGYSIVGSNAKTGTVPVYASGNRKILGAGAEGSWASANYNRAPSLVLHQVIVDNLRFANRAGSGASLADEYAAFVAEMQAVHAAAYATGGYLAGDTYTAAATLKA
jgi:hypothetical protein